MRPLLLSMRGHVRRFREAAVFNKLPSPQTVKGEKMSIFKRSSVKLDNGGDTHAHDNPDKTITVTTQLPGGVSVHDKFDSNINHQDTTVRTEN